MADIPTSEIDLYSTETLSNTQYHYRFLRDLGPVVYLQQNEIYAVTHYDAVKAALRANDILISGRGVGASQIINDNPAPVTLMSDGETHKRRRSVLTRPLTLSSLELLRGNIVEQADSLVKDLLCRSDFCAVRDFASYLPISIVAERVGLSDYGKERMLGWAAATFNALGSFNELATEAIPDLIDMSSYVRQLSPDQLREDGWAYAVLAAAEDGTLSKEEATNMVADYVAPSLDTTILASAQMFWSLASTPGAFEALRANKGLVPGVVNESVRLGSPIRGFTRYAASPFVVGDMKIPSESRVAVLYASANWDEQKYAEPESFQVERNPRDHVGWGHGVHTCAGMHLARLEMESLAAALARHASSISADEPVPIMNNVLQGFAALPARLK